MENRLFWLSQLGQGATAFSKSRLGMLLNTLSYAEQPPTTKNYPAHYVIGIMVEKYWYKVPLE